MKKLVYRKSDLRFVGVVQDGKDFEWEVKNNVIRNFGGEENNYASIETDIERPELSLADGKVIVSKKPKTKDELLDEKRVELRSITITAEEVLDMLIESGKLAEGDIPKKLDDKLKRKKQLKSELGG